MRYTIGQLAEIIDGDRGKNYPKQDEFYPQGYCLFLNTGNVTKEGLTFEENQFITKEKDEALRKGKLKRGDIVYTTRGTVGNAGYYNSNVPYENVRINSGMVILRANGEIVDARFLYQILKSEYYRPYFKQYCTGSAQPQLPIKNFSQIYLNVPDIKTQHRIANILSAYDDLIENNQKQIKLLEEAAQRLYKEWFVDLRFPGHENTKIVDGVPERWSRTNINEILTFHRGYDLTKNEMKAGRYPVVGSTTVIGYHNEFKIKGPGIVTGRSGSLGKYQFIWDNFWPHNTSLYISDYKDHNIFFVYSLLQTVDFASLNNGGAIPTLNRNVLSNIEVIEPTDELQEMFAKIAEPQYQKIKNLEKQNDKLKTARDLLLPKFMSGEVEV